jgi:hypothetical protein
MAIRAMTTPERNYLRSDNQRSQLFLAFTESPPTVFQCVITQVFATHDMVAEFTYDTPTGDLADIIPGMTAWIGTSAGLYDVGMVRIRKDPIAGTLYVSEGSEIAWATGLFVTVVDEMILWPKHLRIVSEVPYMDYDIAYTGQHTVFDPVPIMGCNAVVDVDTDYPVYVKFPEAGRSWVFDSTIAAWLWTTPEVVCEWVDGDTSDPTLIIWSYPANGLIRVALKLTTTAGAEFTGYRYVRVYDQEEDAYGVKLHRPVEVFELGSCRGDYGSGNWSFDVAVYANAELLNIRDRAPVVLFAKDYYGVDPVSIAQLEHRENIVALGWVDMESIDHDPSGGMVSFAVQGAAFWMEKMNSYPSGVRLAKNTPDAWTEMTALTVDRGVWHFLHWRTTATSILDVTLTGDPRIASEMRSPASSLWGQIAEMASTSIMASGGFDQYGRLFLSIEPQMTLVANRTWATIQTIEPMDWEGTIRLDRRTVSDVAQVALSGISVDLTGSPTTYFSLSPGHVFKKYGSIQSIERLLLANQAGSNEMAGLFAGWKNNPYPAIEIKLAQNNRMYTLFPNQFAHLTAQVDERGIMLDGNVIPRSISYEWDSELGVMSTQMQCEAEAFPDLSTNGDVPNVIEADDISSPPKGGKTLPPIPPIVLPPTEENNNLPEIVAILSTTKGVLFTLNANADDPTKIIWQGMNAGINIGSQYPFSGLAQLAVTPAGCLYVRDSVTVWRAESVGGSWVPIATSADFSNQVISGMCINPNEEDVIGIASTSGYSGISYFQIATAGVLSDCGGVDMRYPICVCFADDTWYLFGCSNGVFATPWVYSFESDGTPIYSGSRHTHVGQDAQTSYAVAIGGSDTVFQWDGSGAGGYNFITDGGATVTRSVALTPYAGVQGVSFSPTGIYGMGTAGITSFLSSDGGASWGTTAFTVGPNVWDNCRDDNRWLFGGGSVIRCTLDRGATYTDLMGNLIYLTGLMNLSIVGIRFVE